MSWARMSANLLSKPQSQKLFLDEKTMKSRLYQEFGIRADIWKILPQFHLFRWKIGESSPLIGRAVSCHKMKQFVNIMRDKSLGNCDGSITISTKYVKCDRSDDGKICRSIAQTDCWTILLQNDILHPMKAIFDTPVPANTESKFLGCANQTANITDNLMIFFPLSCSKSFNPD